MSACSRALRIHSNGAVFLKCAPSNPTAELAQTCRVRPSASSAPESPASASPAPRDSRLHSKPYRHWRICITSQLTYGYAAQSAAVFRSPRLQENLPLRAEQGRCCPAWATENGPDPQFRRVVLRHREAQQGEYRFSGERSEPKPSGRLITAKRAEPKSIGQLTGRREIATQAVTPEFSSPCRL